MPKVTKYIQEEVEEIEAVITLLAKSDQWEHYVGYEEETKKIDEMLEDGDLVAARMHLSWVVKSRLPHHLIRVAIEARKDHLDLLGSEPEFPARPQLTNPVTSS